MDMKKKHKKTGPSKINWRPLGNLLYWFKTLSITKHLFVFYLLITVIGSLLLVSPVTHLQDTSVGYSDALFTAASAFSDTGLVTLTSSETWNYFGQAVIAILILIGGIGWFALKVYLFNIILGRPISFATRSALATERGSAKIGVTRRLIRISVTVLLITLVIAAITLSIYFYTVKADPIGHINDMSDPSGMGFTDGNNPYHNWSTSIRFGIFHAISALNNAGFDIMGAHSIMPYYNNFGLQFIFITLFVIGGVGYPVIYDVFLKIKSLFTGEKVKWSLFSKLSMITYVAVSVIGIGIAFALELSARDVKIAGTGGVIDRSFWNAAPGGTSQKTMAIIFNTMSTRNAGFSTIDMHELSSGTLVLYSTMMFIGSAPSSTAGGIRTTTLAIIVLGLVQRMRGKHTVRAFNRRITQDTVTRSYIVVTMAIALIIVTVLISVSSFNTHGGLINSSPSHLPGTVRNSEYCAYVEPRYWGGGNPQYGFTEMFFEVSSAFGTTGLSTGLTHSLSIFSKASLIIIMFIGQLGVSSTLLIWGKRKRSSKHYSFVTEDVSIG